MNAEIALRYCTVAFVKSWRPRFDCELRKRHESILEFWNMQNILKNTNMASIIHDCQLPLQGVHFQFLWRIDDALICDIL